MLIAAWLSGITEQICEYDQGAHQNHCARYNLALFILTKGGELINYYGALITALATIAIAYFTFTLKQSTDNLWRSGQNQLELARAEFISTHRPRIIVYGLDFFGAAPEGRDPDDPIRISFRFVNSGDSSAKIKMVGTRLLHLFKPTMPSDIDFKIQTIDPPLEVVSGRHGFRLTEDRFRQDEFIFNSANDAYSLVCVGIIVYADGNGTDRRMGFCRKYDDASHRWLAMSDPEYEYSY